VVEEDAARRISDSVEIALRYGKGVVKMRIKEGEEDRDVLFSEHFACVDCGVSFPEITPECFLSIILMEHVRPVAGWDF